MSYVAYQMTLYTVTIASDHIIHDVLSLVNKDPQ